MLVNDWPLLLNCTGGEGDETPNDLVSNSSTPSKRRTDGRTKRHGASLRPSVSPSYGEGGNKPQCFN